MDPTCKNPFSAIVSGPSECGKTQFTLKFIDHIQYMINLHIDKILWCFGIYQEIFDKHAQIQFHEGLPDLNIFDGKERTLLIFDDLMSEMNERVTKIFTKISHHRKVSVLYLTQNLFYKGQHTRTISLNANYLVLFKNVRDSTQVANLAKKCSQAGHSLCSKRSTMLPWFHLVISWLISSRILTKDVD